MPTVMPIDPLEPEASRDIWELHTDGVARKKGSGAGFMLKNPNGDEIKYALRFNFQVSNNESEFEALLEGLRLAQEVGAKRLVDLMIPSSSPIKSMIHMKPRTKE